MSYLDNTTWFRNASPLSFCYILLHFSVKSRFHGKISMCELLPAPIFAQWVFSEMQGGILYTHGAFCTRSKLLCGRNNPQVDSPTPVSVMLWVRICRPIKEPRNRFPSWRAGTPTLFDVPARRAHGLSESISWNRFQGSLNIYKFGLCPEAV